MHLEGSKLLLWIACKHASCCTQSFSWCWVKDRNEKATLLQISLCCLASWEKHNSHNFSLYYAAKFHQWGDMSVTSHVLCVVTQVNPQITLWHVPSVSSRGMLVPIAELSDSHWWSMGYFLSSLLKSFQSVMYWKHHQSENQCACICFGNLTLRLLIAHILPNSKP